MKSRKDLSDAFNAFSDVVFENVTDEHLANEIVSKYVFEFVVGFFEQCDENARELFITSVKDQTKELDVLFKAKTLKKIQEIVKQQGKESEI